MSLTKKIAQQYLTACRTAGWWSINPDTGSVLYPPQAEDAGYMGDGPADTMGAALDNIVQQYLDEWERPPTMVELDTAWRFVTGPYRDGDPLVRTAKETFGPRTPLTDKFQYRIKASSDGILAAVYSGTTRIAAMDAYTSSNVYRAKCATDIWKLLDKHPELEDTSKPRWVDHDGNAHPRIKMLSVSHADVYDESLRGQGIGKAMYLAVAAEWFDRNGPFLFMADECSGVGSTSQAARRVWDSLAKQFPSSGRVLAILRRPALPAGVRTAAANVLTPTGKGDSYHADLAKDAFIHFTPADRAKQIVASGKLLMNPPFKKFGPDAVYAVSVKWGSFRPRVQTTHYGNVPLVGILFTTTTMPKIGYTEEVVWDRDVVMQNPKVLPYNQAVSLINAARESVSGEAYVLYGKGKMAADAKYKDKKQVKTKDGDTVTVYEYSERQVANRHREKSERLDKLMGNIDKLEAKLKKDLSSDDIQTRLTALAVALINDTYERVGNEDSADEGHFGVTGWLKKHVSFSGGKAHLKYVGKSGVKQDKTVDDKDLVSALKEAAEGKDPDDPLFDCDDCTITPDEVNEYLEPFDVTAKDLRGYHANREMMERLADIRADGPELPRDRKERDEILKAEFKKALEATSDAVGHEASTLRSQYLVPHLEDSYMKDGTVIESLRKQARLRTASLALERYVRATKTQAEREDEQVEEKLVRRSPKLKPPREDLRSHRIDTDEDPDLEPQGQEGDRDLSLNYKRVASLWLEAADRKNKQQKRQESKAEKAKAQALQQKKRETLQNKPKPPAPAGGAGAGPAAPSQPSKEEQAPGTVIQTADKLRAKNKAELIEYFDKGESEKAKAFAEGTASGGEQESAKPSQQAEAPAAAPASPQGQQPTQPAPQEQQPQQSQQPQQLQPQQQQTYSDHPAHKDADEAANALFNWDGRDPKQIDAALEKLSQHSPEMKEAVENLASHLKKVIAGYSGDWWLPDWQKHIRLIYPQIKQNVEAALASKKPQQATAPAEPPDTKVLLKALTDGDGRGIAQATAALKKSHPDLAQELDENMAAYNAANKALVESLSIKDEKGQDAAKKKAEANRNAAVEALKNLGKPKPEKPAEPEKPAAPLSEKEQKAQEKAQKEQSKALAEEQIKDSLSSVGIGPKEFDVKTKDIQFKDLAAKAEFAKAYSDKVKQYQTQKPDRKLALNSRGKINPRDSVTDQANQMAINEYVAKEILNPAKIAGGLSGGLPDNEAEMIKSLRGYARDAYKEMSDFSLEDAATVMTKAAKIADSRENTAESVRARKQLAAGYLAHLMKGGSPKDKNLPDYVRDNIAPYIPTNSRMLAAYMDDPQDLLDVADADLMDSKATEKVRKAFGKMSAQDMTEYTADNKGLSEAYESVADTPGPSGEAAKAVLDDISMTMMALDRLFGESKQKLARDVKQTPEQKADALHRELKSLDLKGLLEGAKEGEGGKKDFGPAKLAFYAKAANVLDRQRKLMLDNGYTEDDKAVKDITRNVNTFAAIVKSGNPNTSNLTVSPSAQTPPQTIQTPPTAPKPPKMGKPKGKVDDDDLDEDTRAELIGRTPGETWATVNEEDGFKPMYGAISPEGDEFMYFENPANARAFSGRHRRVWESFSDKDSKRILDGLKNDPSYGFDTLKRLQKIHKKHKPGEIWKVGLLESSGGKKFGALSRDGDAYSYFDSEEDAKQWLNNTEDGDLTRMDNAGYSQAQEREKATANPVRLASKVASLHLRQQALASRVASRWMSGSLAGL